MMFDPTRRFSQAASHLRASEIRELLKLLSRPQMISFAGGLPNPEAFPTAALGEVVTKVVKDNGPEALQYGPTEGYFRLRRAIARGMGEHLNTQTDVENILITTGSQQALSLLSTVLLDPGDVVLTASPTYLGALLTFRSMSARVEGVASDQHGIDPDALELKLTELERAGVSPKFLYVVPTFDNPTGITMPLERRQRIYEIASKFDLLIIEDDPYGLLRYEGSMVPPIASLDVDRRVVYLGSFSKILAPGFRVAWMSAPAALLRKAVLAKQAQDLCTNTFGQFAVFEAMKQNLLFPHVETIKALYRRKRDLMLTAVESQFPKELSWNRPEGGLFLWMTLPEQLDALELLGKAIEADVAFVIGRPFFPDSRGHNTFRLNFSYASDGDIQEGVSRLARVIRTELDKGLNDDDVQDQVGIF
jgi:2-aminoadipate transaminase